VQKKRAAERASREDNREGEVTRRGKKAKVTIRSSERVTKKQGVVK
jgi:hypothetical protein